MSRRREAQADPAVTRSEQALATGVNDRDAGGVRARKHVGTHTVERGADRLVEHADSERTPAKEGDTANSSPTTDGSVSIPVYEEQLVMENWMRPTRYRLAAAGGALALLSAGPTAA